MLFNSLEFFVFSPFIITTYFLIQIRYRIPLLLIASYVFYGWWNINYLFIIIFSTSIDYFLGIRLHVSKNKKIKKLYLYLSLIANLGILFFFKYLTFFSTILSSILGSFNFEYDIPTHNFLLPIGISFYTFQTLSYTIDIYRRKIIPETNFFKFALYVSFFPQLLAGPIERAKSLIPQFHFNYSFEYNRVVGGLRIVLWGLFKKIVIADRIATYTNPIFENPEKIFGLDIWFASILFCFQIFCDFSAYSDIALGIAKILGIKLSKNFGNRPYFAKSYVEHWSMTHITLSNWLRDYFFIPFFSRSKLFSVYAGIFITMIICGLWHGASTTFILWGAFHGLGIILGQKYTLPLNNTLKRIIFLISTIIPGLLFGSGDFNTLIILIKNAFVLDTEFISISGIFLRFGLIVLMDSIHLKMGEKNFDEFLITKSRYYRWGMYLFLINMMIYFSPTKSYEFIYFQF